MKVVLMICVAAAWAVQAQAAPSAAARDDAWIERRVHELRPRADEKRFDEIGWAADIRAAKKLAQEHNRPVFLFTHDGRMNIGRC